MEVYEGYYIHVQRISNGQHKAFSNSGDEYVDDMTLRRQQSLV